MLVVVELARRAEVDERVHEKGGAEPAGGGVRSRERLVRETVPSYWLTGAIHSPEILLTLAPISSTGPSNSAVASSFRPAAASDIT